MHGSKLSYRVWWLAIYQLTTNLKGVSSLKLHRDLGICQKSAWHLGHRIRRAWAVGAAGGQANFLGPVEVDETFVGGHQRRRHADKRRYWRERNERGEADSTTRYWGSMVAVAGVKDRRTNRISAAVVPNVERLTLQEFVTSRTDASATVYTDDAMAYRRLPRKHEAVVHSAGEYVREQAHTQGIESFWAMLKRGYMGTYHYWSMKHLQRYVAEFAGRHNSRPVDTEVQMGRIVRAMHRRHLSWARLTA